MGAVLLFLLSVGCFAAMFFQASSGTGGGVVGFLETYFFALLGVILLVGALTVAALGSIRREVRKVSKTFVDEMAKFSEESNSASDSWNDPDEPRLTR